MVTSFNYLKYLDADLITKLGEMERGRQELG